MNLNKYYYFLFTKNVIYINKTIIKIRYWLEEMEKINLRLKIQSETGYKKVIIM